MLGYAFYLLLLGTFANCDTTVPDTPNYLEAEFDITTVLGILEEQISSMDGHIPLLNDSRRQYAVFVHVIYNLGATQSGCVRLNYKQEYQKNINEFVPEALDNAQGVVDEVRKETHTYLKGTRMIRAVILRECFTGNHGSYDRYSDCDSRVQKLVDSESYLKQEARLLLAAGKAAKSFLARHKEFLAASKAHSAREYIVNGVTTLQKVVMDFADYLRVTHENELGAYQC